MKIRIPKWATFQQYKDRRPNWIKLYRSLLENRKWHQLSGDAAKLLVEVWLVASESEDGTIDVGTEDLAWRLHKDPEAVGRWLMELERGEFVELEVRDSGTLVHALPQPTSGGQRTEAYRSVQECTQRRGEENSRGEVEDIQKNPGRASIETKPEYTKGELLEAARKICGLGLWDRQEEGRANSVLVSWYGEGITPERIWAAIHGARTLCDAGKVEWLPRGKPFTLRALRNTGMLYDQGDGKAARPFFGVAEEAYYEQGDGPRQTKRGGTPSTIAEVIRSISLPEPPNGPGAAA